MKKPWIVLIIATAVLAFGVSYAYNSKPIIEPVATPYVAKVEVKPPTASEILELVNAERAKVGVAALVVDENVQRSAQLKAEDMDKFDYFGHIMPNTGKVLDDEMNTLLVASCRDSSENLQETDADLATSQYSVEGWMGSKPHREAILDSKYSKTGIAVAYDDNRQQYIAVQHFCIAK